MHLELKPLIKAIESLERSLNYANSPLAKQDDGLFEQFRNSAIQCFEYTYELCWKFLKRQLEKDAPNPASIDALNYNDLIRQGAESGLIDSPEHWFKYRYYRNLTSHAYDLLKAQEIFSCLSDFLSDSKQFYNQIQKLNT
ncbi:MAG: HI0074 family nucleotidyltransferase substrate-binding subunit [Gammaproteobacteria bacterium]